VSTLAVAIQGKRWELAALCLLMGVTEAAAALPPDAVEGLLEVLAGLEGEERGQRAAPRTRTGGGRDPFDKLRTGRGRRR
jgi:hypothetical protein